MKLFRCVLMTMAIASSFCCHAQATASTRLDDELFFLALDGVPNGDGLHGEELGQAVALLDKGADPNAHFARHRRPEPARLWYPWMWTMCVATEPGNEALLELLLRRGGDPNSYHPGESFATRPITCALLNGNPEAFDILLEAGARLDPTPCPTCNDAEPLSVYYAALVFRQFDVALRLLGLVDVSHLDMVRTKEVLELGSIERSELTRELEIHVRARGIAVSPPVE